MLVSYFHPLHSISLEIIGPQAYWKPSISDNLVVDRTGLVFLVTSNITRYLEFYIKFVVNVLFKKIVNLWLGKKAKWYFYQLRIEVSFDSRLEVKLVWDTKAKASPEDQISKIFLSWLEILIQEIWHFEDKYIFLIKKKKTSYALVKFQNIVH